MASTSELACVYSALILSDDDIEITSDKLTTLLKAACVDFEPYWPNLFAKALVGRNIKDLISNVGTGAGAPAAVATGGGGDAPDAPAEEKKPEKVEEDEESDEDMGFGLFD
uniref:Large ribosomal subunit protein P1 n=1 Tax=Placozoa sp. H4 TaxID=1034858 RepID=M4T8R0_9METZ|nr:60S acidic ribosomal protein P1 [Placozoa sp. H4]